MKFNIKDLRVQPGQKVNLAKMDTRDTPFWDSDDKEGALVRLKELNERLEALQELLWAQGSERILVVIQAMDAGGKDGTVRHVFEGVNPTGVKVCLLYTSPSPRDS